MAKDFAGKFLKTTHFFAFLYKKASPWMAGEAFSCVAGGQFTTHRLHRRISSLT
jgi:hypothetical protein